MDINGVEIFATGRWNDVKTFTGEDLDAMVASFNELAMAGRVPLKFGHNDAQPFTDGQPALGWVSRVWRDGEKLLADFSSMPRVVYDAVKDGIYKFVSIELLRDVMFDGKEFPWVVSAVALLGADIPAVRGLKDLSTLAMSRRTALRSGARVTFTRDVTNTGDRKIMADEKDKPDLTALIAKVSELSTKVEQFSTSNATLTAENERLKKEADDREKKSAKEKVEAHRTAIGLRFDTAIKNKLIYPRARQLFEMNPAFKSDEGVMTIGLDFVDSYIKDNTIPGAKAPAADGEGQDKLGDETSDETLAADESVPASQHVLRLTNNLLANDNRFKGRSFFEANQHVLRTYPKLADKYRYEPGTQGGKAA